jgi:hypothetical protein
VNYENVKGVRYDAPTMPTDYQQRVREIADTVIRANNVRELPAAAFLPDELGQFIAIAVGAIGRMPHDAMLSKLHAGIAENRSFGEHDLLTELTATVQGSFL